MSDLLLGKKIRMTQYFDEKGRMVPVSVVQAGPCRVVQVKKPATDGYGAIQIGFDEQRRKRAGKPRVGHFAKAGMEPQRFLREVRLDDEAVQKYNKGDRLTVEIFEGVRMVDVAGVTKGRGFAGTVKRHNFRTGPKSHGSMNYRQPGSIGSSACPSRVLKGVRMGGHMGHVWRTARHLELVKIDKERNILFIRGGIPGPSGGYVIVKVSKT